MLEEAAAKAMKRVDYLSLSKITTEQSSSRMLQIMNSLGVASSLCKNVASLPSPEWDCIRTGHKL